MDETPKRPGSTWNISPTAKAKTAVQRGVTALLDELAPERVLSRVEQLPDPVKQYRTPSGCVLQAADCAVSVSWFSEPAKDSPLGELHILVWRGKVTRRGMPPSKKQATMIATRVLRPIDPPAEDALWQAADGTRYDTAALAAECLTLLEAQISKG